MMSDPIAQRMVGGVQFALLKLKDMGSHLVLCMPLSEAGHDGEAG
jgi:hypothetical protein